MECNLQSDLARCRSERSDTCTARQCGKNHYYYLRDPSLRSGNHDWVRKVSCKDKPAGRCFYQMPGIKRYFVFWANSL